MDKEDFKYFILNAWPVVTFCLGYCFALFIIHTSDDSIKSLTPIKPEIELFIENNQVDTLYIYRIDE
jgi:hypothetical protein